MVIGKVGEWLGRLPRGKAVVLSADDMNNSAGAYMDSGFDHVRREYIEAVANEVNGDEYPSFSIWERPDGRWTLERSL